MKVHTKKNTKNTRLYNVYKAMLRKLLFSARVHQAADKNRQWWNGPSLVLPCWSAADKFENCGWTLSTAAMNEDIVALLGKHGARCT